MAAYYTIDLVTNISFLHAKNLPSTTHAQLILLLARVIKSAVIILGGIFVLQNLSVDVTSLLAGVTIGGLALSLAAKDAVANFFGSITIFSENSFDVGDVIKISNVEGKVEFIGFRSTRIRTTSDSLISIPNSKFTDEMVENITARRKRRTNTAINISYETKPAHIDAFCEAIRGLLFAHSKIISESCEVNLAGYEENAPKIVVTFFCLAESQGEELRIRHEIFLEIWRRAEKMGIKFWQPRRELLVQKTALTKMENLA